MGKVALGDHVGRAEGEDVGSTALGANEGTVDDGAGVGALFTGDDVGSVVITHHPLIAFGNETPPSKLDQSQHVP